MSAARRAASRNGMLTERERARLREAYATVPVWQPEQPPRRHSLRARQTRRGWCRRCRALTVAAESGLCVQCGGGLAAGYEWVEAE